MASSIHAPRVNNNDDEVKLVSLRVAVGEKISRGQLVAEVETDKAVVEVEAPADGFVLGILANVDAVIAVGSVLLWLGERADEPMPAVAATTTCQFGSSGVARNMPMTAQKTASCVTRGLVSAQY